MYSPVGSITKLDFTQGNNRLGYYNFFKAKNKNTLAK